MHEWHAAPVFKVGRAHKRRTALKSLRSRKSKYQPTLCLSSPPGGPLNASEPNQFTPLMENCSPLAYSLPPRALNSNMPVPRDALARFGCTTAYTTIQARTMKPRLSSLHHSLNGVGLPSSGLVSRGPAAATDFLGFLGFLGFLTSAPTTGCLPAAVGFDAVACFDVAAGFGTGIAGVRLVLTGFATGGRALPGVVGSVDWGTGAGVILGTTCFCAVGLGFVALASGFRKTGLTPFGPGGACCAAAGMARCCGLAGLRAAGFRFAGARGSCAPGFRLLPPNTRPSPTMRAEEQHARPCSPANSRRLAPRGDTVRVLCVGRHSRHTRPTGHTRWMRGDAGWVRCICAPKARSITVVVIAVKLVQVVVETVIRLGIHPGDPAAAAAAAATAAVVGNTVQR